MMHRRGPSFIRFLGALSIEWCDSVLAKLRLKPDTYGALHRNRDKTVTRFNETYEENDGSLVKNYIHYKNLSPKLIPRRRVVLDFKADSDLAKWRVLNDKSFGGQTNCKIYLNSYEKQVETSPNSNEFKLETTYTLVFEGELKPLKPFKKSGNTFLDDIHGRSTRLEKANKAVTHTHENTAVESGNSSKPTPKIASQASPMVLDSKLVQAAQQFPQLEPLPETIVQLADKNGKITEAALSAFVKQSTWNRQPYVVEPPPVGLVHGFCAIISPDYLWPDLNLSPFHYISVRLKLDSRRYLINVRCNERFPYVYQGLIRNPENKSGFQKLEMKLENFVCTFNGRAKSVQPMMPINDISSWGFSISGPAGPFRLELESISACRGIPDWERRESSPEYAEYIDEQVEGQSYNSYRAITGMGYGGWGGMFSEKQDIEDKIAKEKELKQLLRERELEDQNRVEDDKLKRKQLLQDTGLGDIAEHETEAETMRLSTPEIFKPSAEEFGEGMSQEENEEIRAKKQKLKEQQAQQQPDKTKQ